ncbi:MAG: hypothetical protein KIT22_06100 [Verrucomicrobiae bacterium]|nr:hypothetical protein [Verrucomicrobiae bacterium]
MRASRLPILSAGGVALALLLGAGLWLAFRTALPRNPHLASLISEDPRIGCNDDAVQRGELAAAGPEVASFLISKVRPKNDWVEGGLMRLDHAGILRLLQDWVSQRLAYQLYDREGRSIRERKLALDALVLLGPGASAVRPDLTVLATSAPPYERAYALAALTAINPDDPAVVCNYLAHLSLEALRPPNNPPPGWNLTDFQWLLARQFPLIWPTNPAPIEALLPLLYSNDEQVRLTATRVLVSYGTAASNAVPRLLQLLEDRGRKIRPSAAHALGVISPNEHGRLAVEVLLAQQRTNNAWTGDHAHRLFAALGPAASNAVPSLMAALEDPGKGHPAPVCFALWRIQGEASPEILAGLIRGLDTPIQRYQRMSLLALREIGPPASNAVPALRQMLSARHVTLRREAAEAIEAIQGK